MVRLFQRHIKRKVSLLDGIWRFKTDPENKGKDEQWYKNFPSDSMEIVVPSCWNHEFDLYDYEGWAWYATTFTTTERNINLMFHGVTGQAEIFLDGDYIGSHYGGFTGFEFLIKDVNPGKHTLVVFVDNTLDDMNTIPLARVDWFHYGGIIRSVELMELKTAWIKDYKISYQLNASFNEAALTLYVTLEGMNEEEISDQLNIYIDDELIKTVPVTISGEVKLQINNIVLKNIKLWDPQRPNLYNIQFELHKDDVIERIGFREIKVENGKILLNNKEIKLKGVNRHEDHPDWGFAMPLKLMKRDMTIIKDLGCNAIRGSHYPNSEVFLDLCDQEGILFWEEIPLWGYPDKVLGNKVILDRGLQMHREMIKRDYHHPSIIIWGLHNEIDTRVQDAYDLTKSFVEKIRAIDNSRLLTYATMFPLEDICLSFVDIVSINQYIGWYGEELDEWPEFLEKVKEKLRNEGLSHMPIIMSEFGAGAIYGDSTFEGPKWTENYQEKYLDYTLKLFKDEPSIVGTYIWQYCDIRTSKEMCLSRPRSFNNKGLVNEYRKPKMAYWTVRKLYREME